MAKKKPAKKAAKKKSPKRSPKKAAKKKAAKRSNRKDPEDPEVHIPNIMMENLIARSKGKAKEELKYDSDAERPIFDKKDHPNFDSYPAHIKQNLKSYKK